NENNNCDFRITKKLLVNMGLMFLIDELSFTEIKAQIQIYPKATDKKRIVFRLNNPKLTNQVNAIATRNEKHILFEIALNRLFKKMELKPIHELIIDYIQIGGVL
ncbi:MAG: hypothetical protein IKF11_01505, partial [Methanobrevibacter sp.]|nr:hypothetical protein [Methanobrevibacter sp.]